MENSQLKRYSLGLVVKEKPDSTHFIYAIPIEFSMMAAEKLEHTITETSIEVNINGAKETITAKTSNAVKAKWLQINGNQILSPRVMPGDHVMLYRLGDTDVYFWEDLNIANVKRTERHIWAFAADPNEPVKDDLSNANVLEWDTEKKHITLITSKSNGEPYQYVVQINHGEGFITINDDIENQIYLNSKESDIGFRNSYGSYLHINKEKMFGYTKDSMEFEALNKISFKTTDFVIKCSTYQLDASKSVTVNTNDMSVKTATYSHQGQDIKINAETIKHICPMSTFSGMLQVGGLSVGGAGSGAPKGLGNAIIHGDVEITGHLKFKTMSGDKIDATTAHIPNFTPKW